jgi:dihydroxyacetone kinase-like protein
MSPEHSGLAKALKAAATALEESGDELNRLDAFAGDGDMGVTMSEVARALREVVGADGAEGAARLLSTCGAAIARSAPSTSGTLLATGLLRASKALAGGPDGGVEVLERCFTAAMGGIQARGKASVGDRTLVDGLDAICTSLRGSREAGHDVSRALRSAAEAAAAAEQATSAMVPKVGRASWVPERATGHPDAGCAMLAIVMRAAAASVAGLGPVAGGGGPL